VRVVEVPVPDGPGVRIRVRAAGICGSDLEMIRTGLAVNTLGHEIAGETDDGTFVAIHPVIACGTCEWCAQGAQQLCKVGGASLLGVFADGGMSDEMVVDPSCLSPLPAGLRVEDASLVEPLAVALHACHRVGLEPGMNAGVVGGGTVGLLCGAIAKHLGAEVAITARHPAQQRAAEMLGLTLGSSRNCDVVFEAAGTVSGFDDAVKRTRRRGTIALVSTTWEPISISFLSAQMKEITLVPAYVYGEVHGHREFDGAAAVLSAHPEIPAALVTHRFDLSEAPHAFEIAADRAAGSIKVVLHP
jgi:threonine dehydrogenase-like Zn-dependent dehydrogenase